METLHRINEARGVAPGGKQRLLGPAFAHTSLGMGMADREEWILEANSAFLEIVGRSFEELMREMGDSGALANRVGAAVSIFFPERSAAKRN